MKDRQNRSRQEKRSIWVRVIALLAVAAIVLTSGILALAEEPAPAETQAETQETKPMYRMFHPGTHEHLYTADVVERNFLMKGEWNYEGIGWYAPVKSDRPVYRLFNESLRDHHYTTDYNEYRALVRDGWNDEGIAWYSADEKGGIPVYREFTTALTIGAHNFTTDKNEHKSLVASGVWVDEGIAWYGLDGPKLSVADTLPANFMYVKDDGNQLVVVVYNPCGLRTADRVAAVTYSDGHWIDDLKEYEGFYYDGAYLICIPKRERMEPGLVHIGVTADNGSAHTDLGYLAYNLDAVEWKNGWVHAYGQWYHYDGAGNLTAVSDTIPNYMGGELPTEEFAFVSDADSARMDMFLRANNYSSPSRYIILVNRTTHTTGVYEGSKGNWKELMYVTVSDGAPSTPTVEGVFKVGIKMRYFDSGIHRLFYATQFYYDYLFHSISYYKDPQPTRILDGRMGVPISHGCVRMALEDAKWIYDNVPAGTTVVVYH